MTASRSGQLASASWQGCAGRARETAADRALLDYSEPGVLANDLLFNYVVSNWLTGQRPPVFDILVWNINSTQLPAAMYSFYLRSLYGRSELAAGTLELADRPLQLGPSRPKARSTLRSTAALIRRDALTRRRVKDPPDCAFW
jgi:hypothetical protein